MLTLPSKTSISASQARILTHYQLLLKELLPTVWTREKYGVLKTIGKKKGNFIGYWSITSAPCFFWTGLGFILSLKTRENWTLQAPYMSLALRNSKQKPCQPTARQTFFKRYPILILFVNIKPHFWVFEQQGNEWCKTLTSLHEKYITSEAEKRFCSWVQAGLPEHVPEHH